MDNTQLALPLKQLVRMHDARFSNATANGAGIVTSSASRQWLGFRPILNVSKHDYDLVPAGVSN
jgi:hypothetical protein